MTDTPSPLPPDEEQPPVTYASPGKRALAWLGVLGMLLLVAVVTYAIFTGRL